MTRQSDRAYVRGADCVLRTWFTPMFDFSAAELPIAETGRFVRDVAAAGRYAGYPGTSGGSVGFTRFPADNHVLDGDGYYFYPRPRRQRGGLPFQAASQVLGPRRPESLMPLARWRARTASLVFSR